jgi:isopentenyldiphosphate isomerase
MAATDGELLFRVDAEDRVLGSCRRGDAHRLGLRHRAVHILVFDRAGRVLLQKRAHCKDINPGLWDTAAAGHVDYGESYRDCALRELGEELCITAAPEPEPQFKIPATTQTGWEFVQVYAVVWDGAIQPLAGEIDEIRWFDAAAIDRLVTEGRFPLTSSFTVIWKTFRTSAGSKK